MTFGWRLRGQISSNLNNTIASTFRFSGSPLRPRQNRIKMRNRCISQVLHARLKCTRTHPPSSNPEQLSLIDQPGVTTLLPLSFMLRVKFLFSRLSACSVPKLSLNTPKARNSLSLISPHNLGILMSWRRFTMRFDYLTCILATFKSDSSLMTPKTSKSKAPKPISPTAWKSPGRWGTSTGNIRSCKAESKSAGRHWLWLRGISRNSKIRSDRSGSAWT